VGQGAFPGIPGPPAIRVITGKQLNRILRRNDPTELALLTADLIAGRVIIEKPTARQARGITGASSGYVHFARHLSPMDRAAVRVGRLKLSTVARRPSDATLDKFVRRLGPDRVMQSLDRLTTPEA
jgi:hypothetical protein